MTIHATVWDDVCTKLSAFAAQLSPPLPIIFDGVEGKPPDSGLWLEAQLFPQRTRTYGLPDDGPFDYSGFVQVLVCQRPGAGIGAGLDIANEVVKTFKKGTVLADARVNTEPTQAPPLPSPNRINHAVTIWYYASAFSD